MKFDQAFFNDKDNANMPGWLGIRVLALDATSALLEMRLEQRHMNLNNFAHGGAIASLADTTAGYPTYAHRPQDAKGFTTIEFKLNFLRPAQVGDLLHCRSTLIHRGRTTWVWDATVFNADSDKTIAEYRCTNIILY